MFSCSRVAGKNGSKTRDEENIEHRTSKTELRMPAGHLCIRRWMFGVGRSAFSSFMKTAVDTTAAMSNTGTFSPRTTRLAWRTVEFITGGLFIYAGAIKVLDPIGFANDIDNYKILPWAISVRLAFYLPWLEILCGLALIARRLYLGALSILTALLVIFIVASIVAKARGLDITCGCFGHASKNWSFSAHLALDFAILAALMALFFQVLFGNRRKMSSN